MCAVNISDLTLEKLSGSKCEEEFEVKVWNSPERINHGTPNICVERDRVLWNINLTASSTGGEVVPFDVRCWEKFDVSMVVTEGDYVLFNTGQELFVNVFEKLSKHNYQIKADLGCAKISIEGQLKGNGGGALSIISMLEGLKVPVLQYSETYASIEILIKEQHLSAVLECLSEKLKVIRLY